MNIPLWNQLMRKYELNSATHRERKMKTLLSFGLQKRMTSGYNFWYQLGLRAR
jgi:hypothetical protein